MTMHVARNYGPAENIDERAIRDLTSLLDGYRATTGIAHVIMGDAVIHCLKRIPGWQSPYKFFSRTNCKGSWVLVSYHHPAQLCWEWSVWFSIGKRARRSWKPWRWFRFSRRHTSFGVPYLFDFTIHTQRDGWMVSGNAEQLIRFAALTKAGAA